MNPLAVILAGGLGTRLGPLAQGLPKPMVPVGGVPFLDYVVHQLAGQGFEEVLMLVGYRAEVIQERFKSGAGYGISITYSREPQPLGTGGAIQLARDQIRRRFLLLYGDLFRPIDYAAMAERHSVSCLAVYPHVPGLTTIACANVGVDPEGRLVTCYQKDRPDLGLTHVDAGFGVFDPCVLDLLPTGTSNFEGCVYQYLAERNQLDAEMVDRNFFDIGNPTDFAHACVHMPHLRMELK